MKDILFIKFISLWAVCLLASCQKTKIDPKIIVGGHAGSGIAILLSPDDNTGDAVRHCFAYGGETVELDVQMSADQIIYAAHDEFIDKELQICQLESNAVDQLKHPPEKLKYVLLEVPELSTVIIDPKIFDDCTSTFDKKVFLQQMQEFENQYNIKFIFQLSSTFLFQEIKNYEWEVFYAGYQYQDTKQRVLDNGFDGISLPLSDLANANIKDAHQSGLKVMTYNIRSAEAFETALKNEIDVILLDKMDILLNY